MPSDTSLPIIDLTYRPVLEVDRAAGESPEGRCPSFGRHGERITFPLRAALGAVVPVPASLFTAGDPFRPSPSAVSDANHRRTDPS